MAIVGIMHFYNEEFLLPYWVKHHLNVLDYAILIDYHSTDSSVEIIHDLAPNWEIRKSNNEWFSAINCDQEVMGIERSLGDVWKVVLNVTEFILHTGLGEACEKFQVEFPDLIGFRMAGTHMVDPLEYRYVPVDVDEPLVCQRQYGYIHKEGPRNRIVHRAPDGAYDIGRHYSFHQDAGRLLQSSNIFCLWYGYSPYEQSKDRILQIQTRIPPEDIEKKLGKEHMITSDELDEKYLLEVENTYDLKTDENYYRTWEMFCKKFHGGVHVR